MPSPASKIRDLFHRKDKNGASDKASANGSPKSNRNSMYSVAPQSTSPTIPYESTSPRQAPRIGTSPLLSDGRTSLDSSRAPKPAGAAPPLPAGARESVQGQLPTTKRQSTLSDDLAHLSLNQNGASDPRSSTETPQHNPSRGFSQPLTLKQGRYSEDVADWNLVQANRPLSGAPQDAPSPLNIAKPGSNGTGQSDLTSKRLSKSGTEGRRDSISRKPIGVAVPHHREPSSLDSARYGGANDSNKPFAGEPTNQGFQVTNGDREYLVANAPEAPSLKGVIDLSNTVDTSVHESWAPAVTHEVVDRHIHHIREEQITREIHVTDIHHRILPVIDIQVLPARHFVPTGDNGELAEITEDQIPGRTGHRTDWIVAETVSKLQPMSKALTEPRRFTARAFKGNEGDYKEYVSNDGVPRTETTWIHPPNLETGAEWTGQTAPFHFGSENPEDDGLQYDLPTRVMSGSDLSRADGSYDGLQHNGDLAGAKTGVAQPPPVPTHRELPLH